MQVMGTAEIKIKHVETVCESTIVYFYLKRSNDLPATLNEVYTSLNSSLFLIASESVTRRTVKEFPVDTTDG